MDNKMVVRSPLQHQIDQAIALRDLGCTFEMIAWKLDVTKDRARTLVGKANRQRREAGLRASSPAAMTQP